jgi:hypothetical protein
MTCEAWPPCHRMGTLVRIGGDLARDASGRERGNLPLKKGFIPRVAAMSCFSPTRGALSPSSSLRPFAFKVSVLCRHSLPWPCKSISSMPRLSGCSTWCAAYLDRMCRYLPGGLVLMSVFSATFPPKSLCSLFPNSPAGWLCRSHLYSCSCWRGLASSHYPWSPASSFRRPSSPTSAGCPWRRRSLPLLPPAFGGKDDHQPREGGQQAEPRLHPSHPQLFGVGSEPCCGSISLALMALVPPPTLPPTAKRGVAVRPPHERWSRRAQVRHIRGVPYAAGLTAPTRPEGSYKTSYAVGVAGAFLDGLVLTPVGGRGRGPLRTRCGGRRCRQATGAKVSAVTGEPLVKRWPLPQASRSE